MRMKFFGDSYDIVKRFLLETLGDGSSWSAYPMFTDKVSAADVERLESFLGVVVRSTDVVPSAARRAGRVQVAPGELQVFLDPDTGVRLKSTTSAKSATYVFGSELVDICLSEPRRLVVVFDQSQPRGSEETSLQQKLKHFSAHGVEGFAYRSHACFLVLSASRDVVDRARTKLCSTGLPDVRIVCPTSASSRAPRVQSE